jgi:HEAT repeat protein
MQRRSLAGRLPALIRQTAFSALLVFLATLLCACALRALAAEPEPDADLADAEKSLRDAGLSTDGPALLKFFRGRSPSEAEQARLAATVRQLGDESFTAREKASRNLVRAGRASLPFLRPALEDPDAEIARRAADCLTAIEQEADAGLVHAAARVLAARRTDGAAGVLLAYIPFADPDSEEDGLLAALLAVTPPGGKPDPAVVSALTDRAPARRAAAAHVLSRVEEQRPAVRRLLADPDTRVRFRAAAALLRAGDGEAVPALCRLLVDAPLERAYQAEDLLWRLAREKGPAVALGSEEAARTRCRDAWQEWWKANENAVDLSRLGREDVSLGLYVICEHNESGKASQGRVWACGRDGRARWQFDNVTNPVDVCLLPNGRLLVAEHQGRCITERDRQGKIVWRHDIKDHAVSAQRLPNGNTLIAGFASLTEVTRDGKTVMNYTVRPGWVYNACRLPNGRTVYAHQSGLVWLDARGQESKAVALPGMASSWGRVEPLANGHYLAAEWGANRVIEVSAEGKQVWKCEVQHPTSATRLSNGNVLVCSSEGHHLAEINRAGKEVWSIKTTGRPFRARRY